MKIKTLLFLFLLLFPLFSFAQGSPSALSLANGSAHLSLSSGRWKSTVAIQLPAAGLRFNDGTTQTTAGGGGGSSQWTTDTNGITYGSDVGIGYASLPSVVLNLGTALGNRKLLLHTDGNSNTTGYGFGVQALDLQSFVADSSAGFSWRYGPGGTLAMSLNRTHSGLAVVGKITSGSTGAFVGDVFAGGLDLGSGLADSKLALYDGSGSGSASGGYGFGVQAFDLRTFVPDSSAGFSWRLGPSASPIMQLNPSSDGALHLTGSLISPNVTVTGNGSGATLAYFRNLSSAGYASFEMKPYDSTSSVMGIGYGNVTVGNSAYQGAAYFSADALHPIRLIQGSTVALQVHTSGRVQIGTTTDDGSHALQVGGSLSTSGAIAASGAVTASSVTATGTVSANGAPAVVSHGGAAQKAIEAGIVVLDGSGSGTVTFSSAFSTDPDACVCSDATAKDATGCTATPVHVVVSGTAAHTASFLCYGNK